NGSRGKSDASQNGETTMRHTFVPHLSHSSVPEKVYLLRHRSGECRFIFRHDVNCPRLLHRLAHDKCSEYLPGRILLGTELLGSAVMVITPSLFREWVDEQFAL